MGNHDSWKATSIRHSSERVREICKDLPNVHFLDCSIFEYGGVRFLGATMWFSYPGTDACLLAWNWSDFQRIRALHNEVGDYNRAAVAFFENNVRAGDVVITHHLPSNKSIHPMYARANTNCFYVCDMERVMYYQRPKLWIHGHTHESCNYMIDETNIVCNPFGYVPSMLNANFDEGLVIEV